MPTRQIFRVGFHDGIYRVSGHFKLTLVVIRQIILVLIIRVSLGSSAYDIFEPGRTIVIQRGVNHLVIFIQFFYHIANWVFGWITFDSAISILGAIHARNIYILKCHYLVRTIIDLFLIILGRFRIHLLFRRFKCELSDSQLFGLVMQAWVLLVENVVILVFAHGQLLTERVIGTREMISRCGLMADQLIHINMNFLDLFRPLLFNLLNAEAHCNFTL